MTIQEKIELAEKEVHTAEIMLNSSRENVTDWENMLELRTETLLALKEQAKPAKRKVKK